MVSFVILVDAVVVVVPQNKWNLLCKLASWQSNEWQGGFDLAIVTNPLILAAVVGGGCCWILLRVTVVLVAGSGCRKIGFVVAALARRLTPSECSLGEEEP